MILNTELEYFTKLEDNPPEGILKIPSVVNDIINENNLDREITVGFDSRNESKILFDKILLGFSKSNLKIFIQDSFQSFSQFEFNLNQTNSVLGIYCNGGDNPSGFTGIKVILSNKINGKIDISKYAKSGVSQNPITNKTEFIKININDDYKKYLLSKVNIDLFKKYANESPLQSGIIVDANGGATTTIIEDLITQFGWRVHTIFSVPDNKFYSRVPTCKENNSDPLKFNVQTTNALIGIIFNATGSDCAFISNSGNYFKENKSKDSILNSLLVIEELIKGKSD